VIDLASLKFESTKEVEGFATWYLRTPIPDGIAVSEKEYEDFLIKRSTHLKSELFKLSNFDHLKAVTHSIKGSEFYHIGLKNISNPMGVKEFTRKNSRFNFKDVEQFRNQALYFGVSRRTCYIEKFHLDLQRKNYSKLLDRSKGDAEAELPYPKFKLSKYKISLKKVMVLTTDTTLKSAGISSDVVKNEWYNLNTDFIIPTAGQIISSIARENGFEGILYTSVRYQMKNNLVIFKDNTNMSAIELLDSRPYDPEVEECR